jgi:hypothetical protein
MWNKLLMNQTVDDTSCKCLKITLNFKPTAWRVRLPSRHWKEDFFEAPTDIKPVSEVRLFTNFTTAKNKFGEETYMNDLGVTMETKLITS